MFEMEHRWRYSLLTVSTLCRNLRIRERDRERRRRKKTNLGVLREFSSLSKIFPVCLQPGCLFFTPPLILSLRRLHFTLGGPQTPSTEWGAFRVPWWMLMGDSFRSFYRVGLWSAGWLALHRLDIQRTCNPPPPWHTHKNTCEKTPRARGKKRRAEKCSQTRKKRLRMRLRKDKGKCKKGRD